MAKYKKNPQHYTAIKADPSWHTEIVSVPMSYAELICVVGFLESVVADPEEPDEPRKYAYILGRRLFHLLLKEGFVFPDHLDELFRHVFQIPK